MLAAQWKEAGSMPNAGHLEAVELSSNNWSRVKGKKGAYCNIMFIPSTRKHCVRIIYELTCVRMLLSDTDAGMWAQKDYYTDLVKAFLEAGRNSFCC